MSFTLFPAIDLVEGKAVRLVQGQAGSETTYGDPLQIAADFAAAGATWLHLVDLDAAFGRGSNADLVEKIVTTSGLKVEVSGGLRDDTSLERMLGAGAARVNVGTAALENPDWCGYIIAAHGEKIAIGLDVKDGQVVGRGWTQPGGTLGEVMARLEAQGCARYVVTDVSRDGTLTGPGIVLLQQVCALTEKPVVASGGVSSLEDIANLRELEDLGVEGAIVGKALYEGRFTLGEALKVARGE